MSNLSQAEIDALLRGEPQDITTAGHTGELDISAYAATESGSSQDQQKRGEAPETDESRREDISRYFSPAEIDALGEIGNICMGTSATTMNMLLGRKVTITTPEVSLYKAENVLAAFSCPFLAINVEFVEGLYGKNLLILKDYDAALITDLLMGGEGSVEKDNIVLTEIHLSAVSEIMNQMIGSAATAMSKMMGDGINISPPRVARMTADESIGKYLDGATPVVKISFDMEIEGLLKSKLLQIMSVDMARELIVSLMHPGEEGENKPEPPNVRIANAPPPFPPAAAAAADAGRGALGAVPAAVQAGCSAAAVPAADKQRVKSVKPAQYNSFEEDAPVPPQETVTVNFDLINDIPLQVTVELGKTKKNLSDILNFGVGSIIVLDKQAGELVDVIVNGKQIAKGEVVVIDENYGVRITELIRM